LVILEEIRRIDPQVLISSQVLNNNNALLVDIWYKDTKFECDVLKRCNNKLREISIKLHDMMVYEAELLEVLEGKVEGKIENQDEEFAIKAIHDNFQQVADDLLLSLQYL